MLNTKTIKHACLTSTVSLASNTQFVFPDLTIDIPETNSREFVSAILRITFHLDNAAAGNFSSRQAGVQIDAVAAQDNSASGTVANTGDHECLFFHVDLTSYFQTNYTGTSHVIKTRTRLVGSASINITAEWELTYKYEETGEATLIKTIEIPLDSPVAALTNTLAEIGTNQIEILNNLPETGKVFKDIYFRIDANASSTTVTDTALGLSLDADIFI